MYPNKKNKNYKTQNKEQQKRPTKYSILYSKLVPLTHDVNKLQILEMFFISLFHEHWPIDPPTINPMTTDQPITNHLPTDQPTHQPPTPRPHTHQPSDLRFIDQLARSYLKDLIYFAEYKHSWEMKNYTLVYLNICLYN